MLEFLHPASRRIRFLQLFTISWMTGEAGSSLLAAWLARSPSLLAFGGDSLIELLSASVVFWRFTSRTASEQAEHRASRMAGVLLLLLAGYVTLVSVLALLGYGAPRPTLLGIFVLAGAAVVMPLLAREKRKLSGATGSAALRADAAQSSLCGYLAVMALVGVVTNFVWGVERADSVAALAIVPLVVYEAREAIRGKPCSCV